MDNHYKTLGVAKTAKPDDIKKAYRKLARKHHPDISKAAGANDRMMALNAAHAVLSDPDQRAAYDAQAEAMQAPVGQRPVFRHPTNGGAQSRFFKEFFARGAGHGDGRSDPGRRAPEPDGSFADVPRPQRGSDHHAQLDLDLLDAFQGAERSIALRSVVLHGGGSAVHEERHLAVQIPKGVHAGQHIRLAGRGSPGRGGAAAGDLLLEVRFKPDPRWRAEGRDVYQRLPLAPWEAALGATVQVHTPGGDAEVTVPAGWKPGRKLRLKDRGIPGRNEPGGRDLGQTAGHLYLELELALPAADTDATRAAYAALALAFPGFAPRA